MKEGDKNNKSDQKNNRFVDPIIFRYGPQTWWSLIILIILMAVFTLCFIYLVDQSYF